MTRYTRTLLFHAILAGVLVLTIAGLLLAVFRPAYTWYSLLTAWLVAVNLTVFGYYAHDKAQARAGGERIPEVVLHALAALGGSPGAYLGMVTFHHKTLKGSFRILFWLTVALQGLLVVAILWRIFRPDGV